MADIEIRPSAGELWKKVHKDDPKDTTLCLTYKEEDGTLYKAWFSSAWIPSPVEEDMVSGKNGWVMLCRFSQTFPQ